MDAYAFNLLEGNVEVPQINKTQREMEKEIINLRGQIEGLLAKNSGSRSVIPYQRASSGASN